MTPTAARTVAWNVSGGWMTWSAGMTIIVPSGSALATIAAARPTQGAVSRGQGSATTLPGGSCGNCSRTAAAWSAPVMIQVRSGAVRGAMRATVCWSIDASPCRRSNCLGRSRRLLGQNRVPLPPAMITAWSMSEGSDENSRGRGPARGRRDQTGAGEAAGALAFLATKSTFSASSLPRLRVIQMRRRRAGLGNLPGRRSVKHIR